MRYQIKKVAIFTLAILFIILGIVGLALPFLQGFLFLIIGVLLLSIYSPSLRQWIERRTTKYPKVHVMVLKVEDWLKRVVGEV